MYVSIHLFDCFLPLSLSSPFPRPSLARSSSVLSFACSRYPPPPHSPGKVGVVVGSLGRWRWGGGRRAQRGGGPGGGIRRPGPAHPKRPPTRTQNGPPRAHTPRPGPRPRINPRCAPRAGKITGASWQDFGLDFGAPPAQAPAPAPARRAGLARAGGGGGARMPSDRRSAACARACVRACVRASAGGGGQTRDPFLESDSDATEALLSLLRGQAEPPSRNPRLFFRVLKLF